MTEESISRTPDVVAQIAQRLSDMNLTEEQVDSVLATWNHLREGDPLGTVRRDEKTGAIAHRVDADGVHLWRVSDPRGELYNDMQPTLSWPVIHEA